MKNHKEPLPCPFCGNGAGICDNSEAGGPLYIWVSCNCCGAKGSPCVTEDEAVAAWNRRPREEELARRLEAAHEVADDFKRTLNKALDIAAYREATR